MSLALHEAVDGTALPGLYPAYPSSYFGHVRHGSYAGSVRACARVRVRCCIVWQLIVLPSLFRFSLSCFLFGVGWSAIRK